MKNSELLFLLKGVSLAVAMLALVYKLYVIYQVRKRRVKHVSLKLLSFYSDEQICSTYGLRKRRHMIVANWATGIMLACLIPNLGLALVKAFFEIIDYMDSIG